MPEQRASSMQTSRVRHPEVLSDLLNYRLYRLYVACAAPGTRTLEGKWGVTRREWRLLASLATFGELAPSDLADRLHLDRPRTSRAISSLAAKGLAKRTTSGADARRALVGLTPSGQHIFDQAFPEIAAMNTRVLDVLDDKLLAALCTALDLLTRQAEKLSGETATDVHANRRAGGSRHLRDRGAP